MVTLFTSVHRTMTYFTSSSSIKMYHVCMPLHLTVWLIFHTYLANIDLSSIICFSCFFSVPFHHNDIWDLTCIEITGNEVNSNVRCCNITILLHCRRTGDGNTNDLGGGHCYKLISFIHVVSKHLNNLNVNKCLNV